MCVYLSIGLTPTDIYTSIHKYKSISVYIRVCVYVYLTVYLTVAPPFPLFYSCPAARCVWSLPLPGAQGDGRQPLRRAVQETLAGRGTVHYCQKYVFLLLLLLLFL